MSFFRNFPLKTYNFGDNEPPSLFQDLSVYVDLIDQVQDDISFYEVINILDGERPDTLSQKLYDTPDYYWQFYLLNDNIRLQGWPLRYQDMLATAKERYPNIVLTTEYVPVVAGGSNLTYFETFAEEFTVGKIVTGTGSGATARILERNLDLGQLVVKPISGTIGLNASGVYNNENIAVEFGDATQVNTVSTINASLQYNAVHHYEDTDGNIVDIDPFDQTTSTSGKIPITHLERFELENEALKSIRCFVPDVANQVNDEFQKLLRNS
mgnify:CR=1 FL=1